jgi:L-lysine exporter family protein LysE/ArgO
MAIGGALFLFAYGASRFHAAYIGNYEMTLAGKSAPLAATLATAAAFTWLNPHVYLDTLGLIGAVSTQYETGPLRLAFGLGAVTSSFVFVFGLGYGAQFLAPVMQKARSWQILDVIIGTVMWLLAIKLVIGVFTGLSHA